MLGVMCASQTPADQTFIIKPTLGTLSKIMCSVISKMTVAEPLFPFCVMSDSTVWKWDEQNTRNCN